MKPSAGAFRVALDGMGLSATEVLFFDDSARNIEAARALGLQARRVRGPAQARDVLVQYDVLSSHAA